MKINLNQKIVNLKGEPLKDDENKDVTLGKALANIIASSEEKGKMKLFILAQKFYNEDKIDLDSADLSLVKKVVSESRAYVGALVIGQVELLLSEMKE